MRKRIPLLLSALFLVSLDASAIAATATRSTPAPLLVSREGETDRTRDGLQGPVRRVRTETSKLVSKGGKLTEGARTVLETATYDAKGAKIDTAYFLGAGGALTGKEVYQYDDKGNIVEMTLFNTDGSVLSKEKYEYEFDAMGNWTKMTTSVAVIENGQMSFEPTEVTYRIIAYYLEDATARKLQNATATNTLSPNTNAAANVTPAVMVENKPAASSASPAASSASPAAVNPAPVKPAPAATTNAQPNKTLAAPANSNAAVSSSNTAGSNVTAATNTKRVNNAPALPATNSAAPVASPTLTLGAPAGMTSATNGNSPVVKSTDDLPPPPVKAVAKAPVRPVSAGVLNGKALEMPKPLYPEAARRARLSGVVTVEVVIDVSGKVIGARAVSGPDMLRDAAERAARQAKFTPALLAGQPVRVSGVISYNFSL